MGRLQMPAHAEFVPRHSLIELCTSPVSYEFMTASLLLASPPRSRKSGTGRYDHEPTACVQTCLTIPFRLFCGLCLFPLGDWWPPCRRVLGTLCRAESTWHGSLLLRWSAELPANSSLHR